MINNLRNKIKNILLTIDKVSKVYDCIPEKVDGFPAIVFNFDRVSSENQDSCHNERVWTFQINILQELSQMSQQEAEIKVCDILDEVINLFDKSDLGIKVEAVGGDIGQVNMESGPALIGTILLGIHSLYNLHN